MDQKPTIYISYSNADQTWSEKLVQELHRLPTDSDLSNWDILDDDEEKRRHRITSVLGSVQAAILLLSEAYLKSQFIRDEEMPRLLERRNEDGFYIFSVLVASGSWQQHEELATTRMLPEDLGPLAARKPEEAERELHRIAQQMAEVLRPRESTPLNEPPPTGDPQNPSVNQQPNQPPPNNDRQNQPVPTDDLAPLEDVDRRYRFSYLAQLVVDEAKELARGLNAPVPVTSSFLLFAMLEQGRGQEAHGVPQFLWNYIEENVSPERFQETRRQYLERQNVYEATRRRTSKAAGQEAIPPQKVTRNALAALQQAWSLAQKLGEAEIHARHLLAALIVPQPPDSLPQGAHRRFEQMGVEREAICEAFLEHIRPYTGDRQGVWEEFLRGKASNLRWLPGYTADMTRGRDFIDISQEVNAFATLIATPTVLPPLAIGLFGEWGSGKTFFMNRLRLTIDELTKEMNKGNRMQRDLPFYKRIIQIEFNAWHYVQGELWPSLVQHILDNLRLPGEKMQASQILRNHLIQKLHEAKTGLETAQTVVQAAKQEASQAKEELKVAQAELRNKEKELRDASVLVDVQNFLMPQIQDEVNNLLTLLGMPPVGAAARDLGAALQETREVLERGNAVLTPLLRAEDRDQRLRALVISLLVAPLVGALIGLIPALLGQEAIAQITTLATGGATLIITGTNWLRNQTAWLKSHIEQAEAVQRKYDTYLTQKLAEHIEKVRQLEQELSQLRDNLATAERKKEEAERRVAEAQAQVDQATTTNLLADYIQDRAASQDYRKHLGVLALIRRDFETLSSLMEEENWRLAPFAPDDDQTTYKTQKYSTPEEEKREEMKRINRIVLYIDDLDRCPPEVVTDVLQAVHLLLAFPLFVVVVAVDARWIKRSLRARYHQLLHTDGPDEREEIFGKATPDDYLEKIFQIPFWLKPMDPAASRRMVQGLLRDSLEQPEPAVTSDNGAKKEEGKADTTETMKKPGETPSAETPEEKKSTDPTKKTVTPIQPDPDINATRLRITQKEMDFINELAPLLGRSPRALKRFVNVYRLIKAGLSEHAGRRFLEETDRLSDYQAVLFLLAVDTGLPDIAETFFSKLQRLNGGSANSHPDKLVRLIDQVEGSKESEEWSRLKDWLSPLNDANRESKLRLSSDLDTLAAWMPRVARYSFYTDPSQAENLP